MLLSRFRVINTLPKEKQDARPGGYEGRKGKCMGTYELNEVAAMKLTEAIHEALSPIQRIKTECAHLISESDLQEIPFSDLESRLAAAYRAVGEMQIRRDT